MVEVIIEADCVQAMAEMPEASVDAIVTDPPYGIRFMGKAWDGADIEAAAEAARVARPRQSQPATDRYTVGDEGLGSIAQKAGQYDLSLTANRRYQAWCEQWATECFRVLKPGGHLLASCGTRTYHRMTAGIEDAGFEIRDCLAWLYGSGFPKSLDVSKAIDKAAGAERQVIGRLDTRGMQDGRQRTPTNRYTGTTYNGGEEGGSSLRSVTTPATPEAEQWRGWGTALKPAHEPIVMARKPLAGTVAQNVLEHGTGALNVDGCRIGYETVNGGNLADNPHLRETIKNTGSAFGGNQEASVDPGGRWPANVLLDEQAAEMLDEQTGEMRDGVAVQRNRDGGVHNEIYGAYAKPPTEDVTYGGSGGASRFLYVAKASSAERNAGLETERNVHPTVKPIELMRWLVRLVTPPSGTVLDPFTGSGTTGIAAGLEGLSFIGIEREAEYAAIARARIAWWAQHPDGLELVKALEADRERKRVVESGQLGLLP